MSSFRRKTKKDGTVTYTWRATVPYRQADGTIGYKPVERGTGVGTLSEARAIGKQLERQYHERANLPLSEDTDDGEQVTFAMAALSYMQSGGERTYLAPILERIGSKPLPEITQEVVQQLADEMKPGRKPSYINRCIYTPINAVLNFGAKLKMCPPPILMRPRGHDRPPTLRIPDDNWYRAIWPYLAPSKRAAVLLLRLHGLRASEALKRRPADVNMARGELTVETSKTGDPFVVRLSEPVLEAIREIPNWPNQRWLFGSQYVSNFHKAIKRACELAGVETYGSHSFGRHAFSTAILREGRSLKFLKEAGRWKKIAMPAERYGHLEQSEVDEDVRKIAAGWQGHKEVPDVIRLSAKRSK